MLERTEGFACFDEALLDLFSKVRAMETVRRKNEVPTPISELVPSETPVSEATVAFEVPANTPDTSGSPRRSASSGSSTESPASL